MPTLMYQVQYSPAIKGSLPITKVFYIRLLKGKLYDKMKFSFSVPFSGSSAPSLPIRRLRYGYV